MTEFFFKPGIPSFLPQNPNPNRRFPSLPRRRSMEITEEQWNRAEMNRLAALEKRKRGACSPISEGRDSPWRLFKCKKIVHDQQKNTKENYPPPPPPPPPTKFSVVLEICSPSEFTIFPQLVQGFFFPGEDECFRRIQDCFESEVIILVFPLSWIVG